MTHRQTVPQGTILFHPGDECAGFVIVHGGCIKVTLTAENGREIVLYRVQPGEICLQTFGCLTSHHPYSAEGIAESDVDIEILPESEFQQRVAHDPAFRAQLFHAVSTRFSDMERLIEDVALSGLQHRLARLLLRLAGASDSFSATHEALAAEIGSGRAAISRTLGSFARAGVVEAGRGSVRILDREALAAISGGEAIGTM